MIGQSHRYHSFLICICLVAAIIAVYWPVYNYEFVKYDDDTYVTNNANIQSGLNRESFRWAFTTGYASNWHPVTWLSHALDYQLFGDWAGGHHLINVLLHIANTLVLFCVLVRMTGVIWPSAFVAAVFALHPLHVESVAWIAERKDLLSTLFWMLTMLAYVRYVGKPKLVRYLVTVVLFALGLMAKPMLVTVPFVLLLLDFWPLQRKISYRLLIEKIPFFIFSFASCVVTFLVQRSSGAMAGIESFGLGIRINNAIVSYVSYIAKMIWPSGLAVLYPHPGGGLSTSKVVACGLMLVLISIWFIYSSRRHRFLTMGWFWYLGTLVPVIGLVQVGVQAMADRYAYVTLTGLFIIIAWSAKELIPKWRYRNIILTLSAAAIVIGWALTASRQVRYWKDSLTLFEHTLQVTENNHIILSNYATYLGDLDRLDESIEQFNKLLKIRPNLPEAHNNLGSVLLRADKAQQAIEHFKLAIGYKPDFPKAYYNLGNALKEQGRLEEAVSYYKQAAGVKPDFVDAYLNLAITFNEMKKFDEAIESCKKALELKRSNVIAHGYLGLALAGAGKTDEAIEEIRFVLKARPDDVEMYRNLGILLERKGETAEAIKSYRAALQIDPNLQKARELLNALTEKQNHPQN
jgi:tetratricopeptide (TPR) repeat protein